MTPWRILSDDLTGALDSAAAWAGATEVPVFLDAPGPSTQPVQVVVSGTRDVPPAELPARLEPSLDWFAASGFAFKKIDSLLRGNSFAEIAWLLKTGRFAGAVFAPAFPAQGRFTAQGRHWVAPPHQPQGARSHEHAEPLGQAFAGVGLHTVQPARLQDCLQAGGQVVIPDLLTDADIDQLAALSAKPQARHWLWCGSAGLAWALARRDGASSAANSTSTPPHTTPGAPLLLTASRHPVLRAQLRQLDPDTEVIDLAAAEPLSPTEAQAHLAHGMQQLVARHARPATLVVVGGDTLLALCRAAGVHSLQTGPSPRAGWGCARLCGGPWDGLFCYSRSGAFGPNDDLRVLLTALTLTSEPSKEPTP